MKPYNDDSTVFTNMNQNNGYMGPQPQYDPATEPYQEPGYEQPIPEEAKKGKGNLAAKVGAGVVGGGALGAGMMFAGEAIAGSEESLGDHIQDATAAQSDSMQMASVNDNMSFADAFEAARDQVGPGGVFIWRGGVYGTYTQDEWAAMSPEDRAAFTDEAMSQYGGGASQAAQPASTTVHEVHEVHHYHHDHHHPHGPAPEHAPAAQGAQGGHTAAAGGHTTGEVDPNEDVANYGAVQNNGTDGEDGVRIIGSRTVEMEGEMVDVVDAEVDGHYGMFVDTDHDGEVDMYGIDYNDNGQFDDDEIVIVSRDGGFVEDGNGESDDMFVDIEEPGAENVQVVETDPVTFDDPEVSDEYENDGLYTAENTDDMPADDPVSFDDPEVYVADNASSDGMDDFINDANVDMMA